MQKCRCKTACHIQFVEMSCQAIINKTFVYGYAGTSFSFLSPANHPCEDIPDDDDRARVGVMGLLPCRSGSLIRGWGRDTAQEWLSCNSQEGPATGSASAAHCVRPRSATSASGTSALVIQPIRSMRDCSHSSHGHRSPHGSHHSSVCGSESSPMQH